MSVTVIGGGSPVYPRNEATVLVEVKESWADGWEIEPELVPVRASWHSGHDIGSLTLTRRYGATVWDVADGAFEARDPFHIRNWWVRLQLLADEGLQTIWQGRIASEQRSVRLRRQKWVALGPQDLLRRIDVHHCHWYDGAAVIELGRVPSVNMAGPEGLLVGNCSTARQGDSYVYFRRTDGTDTSLWSHYDYLEYVLERFVNATGRPVWTIGGQTSILRNLQTYIRLTGRESAMDLLRLLVPPHFGIDYVIVPTEAGFEIRVFALSVWSVSFAGQDFPTNPDTTRIEVQRGSGSHEVVQCTVEHSSTQQYDRIRVVGERKRTQFSMTNALGRSDLRILWEASQETAYKELAAGADKKENDNARRDDRFATVYQGFGAAADFDFDSGRFLPPVLDTEGNRTSATPNQQTVERATLPRLLTRKGWSYSLSAPYKFGATGAEPDFMPPLAMLQMNLAGLGLNQKWLLVDRANALAADEGIAFQTRSIAALENDWGLQINVEPNHCLASGHWAGAAVSSFDPSTNGFDYEDLILTIAIETDERLEVGYDVPPQFGAGDGGTLVIEAPGCHYWYLAPNTYLGVATDGEPIQSYSSGTVLRNDAPRMALLMAGAIARYACGRSRCRLRKQRLEAWGELVGRILTLVEEEGDVELLGIPITSVEWSFVGTERGTRIRAGYAS